MDDETFKQEWGRRHGVLYRARVSFRYHRRRQRFFDLLEKGTKAATVLAGASLLSSVVQSHLPVAAAFISGAGLLSLVYAYSDRKQVHRELADSFAMLTATIRARGEVSFTREDVDLWTADLARLEAKEPPTLRTLVMICENEESVATGHPGDVAPVSWWRCACADWFSLPGARS